ncbi:hypothetical protein [Ensifer soli]|uniref:hypothetical protein n=1 Tax=Ciceribacter sp. sgz301302 TaxID=3342379 RepID=UPI0035BABDA3
MSAVISIAGPDAAFMLTDGAGYDDDGVVRTLGYKVVTAADVPLAVNTRGISGTGKALARQICALADRVGVDRFLEILPRVLDELRDDPELAPHVSGANALERLR